MRVRAFFKEIRGPRSLRKVAEAAGINPGMLSRIEQGVAFPKDDEIPALAAAYGAPITDWYPPLVIVAMEFDDTALEALRERLHEEWLASR
jgi:transcriptional regulator with XRE-family HTH domain